MENTQIYQEQQEESVVCLICPNECSLKEGQAGLCHARRNEGGIIISSSYAKLTALALDSIEKKPLSMFCPGSYILSAGSFGCNLRCGFCQNHEISMCERDFPVKTVLPEELSELALSLEKDGNIGIALTYNEPLIGFEYAGDTFALAKKAGLKTVLVTNGYACARPFEEIVGLTDAMNIDLKAFSDAFYKKIGGRLDVVLQNIETAAKHCHVELTTLIIPGENDDETEMDKLAKWVGSIDETIPLHISRFFPRYKMMDVQPTDKNKIMRLVEIAGKHLKNVFTGNV